MITFVSGLWSTVSNNYLSVKKKMVSFCKLTFCGLNNSKLISTGAGQCDSPFGMEDGSIGDNDIIASSSFNESSRASQARLHLRNDNSTAGAWCAAQNKVVSHTSFIHQLDEQRWHSRLMHGLCARVSKFNPQVSHPYFDFFSTFCFLCTLSKLKYP